MKIYIYNPKTLEFVKESYAAINLEKSKLAGEAIYDIPANSTLLAKPNLQQNETCLFLNDEWVVKKDFRGHKFFDPISLKTIVIDFIGEVPDNYISLESKDFINYLNQVNHIDIYNSVKNSIENDFNIKINEPILINKYYFNLNDLPKYIKAINEITNNIRINKKKIEDLEHRVKQEKDIEKNNKLKEELLSLYDNKEPAFSIIVKNKRRKDIEVIFNYTEFVSIVTRLQKVVKELKTNRDNLLNKIDKLSKYDLIVMQQRALCRKGKENAKTGNEENAKEDSETC